MFLCRSDLLLFTLASKHKKQTENLVVLSILEEQMFLKHTSSLLNSSLWNLQMLAITLQTAEAFTTYSRKMINLTWKKRFFYFKIQDIDSLVRL